MELEMEHPAEMYGTTNQTYGLHWNTGGAFPTSFTQSVPYKQLTNTRQVQASDLPKDRTNLSLVHDPRHPCGIQSMSNVPMNTRGEFTNVRRDYASNCQGLWSNASFNTPGATIDRGQGTYSNLQGGWGRVGPSTYDSVHGNGPWVDQWGTRAHEPATLRSLRDHSNVDPRDGFVPMENTPQNQSYQPRP